MLFVLEIVNCVTNLNTVEMSDYRLEGNNNVQNHIFSVESVSTLINPKIYVLGVVEEITFAIWLFIS